MAESADETARGVVEQIPLGICVASVPRGEIIFSNTAFRTIMGMDAVVGADVDAAPVVYGIFDRRGSPYPVEKLPFSRVVASGEPVVVDDIVIHRRDGGHVCMRVFANPVRDEHGDLVRVVIAFTDITAEVKARAERAEIARHLDLAIDHAPVLVFTMDAQGILIASEGALRESVERDRPSMIGQSILEAYKDNPTVVENVRRALAGHSVSYSVEVDGGMVLDVWIDPMRDATGALVGAIGVCRDITETRILQKRIIQDDRVRAMGTLAASVAHEINNPLTYVLSGLQAGQRELDGLQSRIGALAASGGGHASMTEALASIDRVREYLAPAFTGTDRIRQVTRDLSTFSRRDDERLVPVDVPGVVRAVLKLVHKEIIERARLVEELGATPPVLANEARMVQVLFNLFANAWQSLPSPNPEHHVVGVRTGTVDSNVSIEIWDSGPGIAPERRERIFEPFITTKTVGSGTGLGLFVCRNIINALQGTISVHDAPGGGALFRILLPPCSKVAEVVSRAQHAGTGLGPAAGTQRRRLLVIDDDAEVAGALAIQLSRLFEVRAVLDGREGLDIILGDDVLDLIYCDLMMSGFSGMDLFETLQAQAPERLSRVVFMTGGAYTEQARRFQEQLGDKCMEKPFDVVADAVRRCEGQSAGSHPA